MSSYRSEENPICVEEGKCRNSTLYGGDPCFALQLDIDLEAGVKKTINGFLGTAMTEDEIKECVSKCREADFVEKSFAALKNHWDNYLGKFTCEIPYQDGKTNETALI